MATRPELLNQMIEMAQKVPLTAVFDLDSTLFDVSPRITKILHAFAEIPEIKSQYPEASAQLLKIAPAASDYGVLRTLMRNKFRSPGDAFNKTLVEYWKSGFFSNDYLYLDAPYPGAQKFVNDLSEAGARVLYLTGRDVPRMLKGTILSLENHKFPLEKNNTNLFLKPNTEIGDGEFKRDFFKKLDQTKSDIWFFENEPRNLHLVIDHYPHIKAVFVATVHSNKDPEPGTHIPRIQGFIS